MAQSNSDPNCPREQDISSELSVHERLRGNLYVGQGLRVSGIAEGNIKGLKQRSTLVVAASGHVEGNIHVTKARIDGSVKGRLDIEDHIHISEAAVVDGELVYGSISVAEGARINGTLTCRYSEVER